MSADSLPVADRTNLDHLFVHGLATDQPLSRKSAGDPKIRPVEDRASHGAARRQEAESAADEFRGLRDAIPTEELRSLGVIVTIRAVSAEYPLKLESLERWSRQRDLAERRPRWQLLAATSDDAGIESAAVWIADEDIADFFKFFDDYLTKDRPSSKKFPDGHPYNDELVANMGEIRRTVASDMWTSGRTPPTGQVWWELVLRSAPNSVDVLRQIAEALDIRVSPSTLQIGDRIIVWVEARWNAIELLTLTKAPLHEIRRPSQVNLVLDLPIGEQDDYVDELIGRLDDPSPDAAVAVCLLDTGVLGGHNLLAPFIHPTDIHTAVPPHGGADVLGHGTRLAGLALFGDLQNRFDDVGPVTFPTMRRDVNTPAAYSSNGSKYQPDPPPVTFTPMYGPRSPIEVSV